MKKAEGITEKLKAAYQTKRVGKPNSIRQRAKEIVFHDLPITNPRNKMASVSKKEAGASYLSL